MIGLIGVKVGMTQIFDEQGAVIPVTVIKINDNVVVSERTEEKDGYSAALIGSVDKKNPTKPYAGQFPKGVAPKRYCTEIKDFEGEYAVGDSLSMDLLENVTYVDVIGTCKGKGYQGVVRRHGFAGGRKTHGSKFHRANGSTGMAAWPSRVIKGTKMPGRMGNSRVTVQNLKLVKVDKEKKVVLVKGAVPGTRNSMVFIRSAVKKENG
ncbi:MAG: 50S ribosomal protein L3 [Spirochaetales bacterium]|nr:50S ribosomal protein L3 [Spirochaetales bacterium]